LVKTLRGVHCLPPFVDGVGFYSSLPITGGGAQLRPCARTGMGRRWVCGSKMRKKFCVKGIFGLGGGAREGHGRAAGGLWRGERGYVASVPTLAGCVSQGDTGDEALRHIREAIELYVEECKDAGDPVPTGGAQCRVGLGPPAMRSGGPRPTQRERVRGYTNPRARWIVLHSSCGGDGGEGFVGPGFLESAPEGF
jgi:predicted RNase H-like HicB family nuclease